MIYVAEVGSNWNTFQDCMDSIVKAKASKASAVKFQLFSPHSLFGPQTIADFQYGICPYLSPGWLPDLAERAKLDGIEFLCTGFSVREYELINEHVKIHKIASAEITDTEILRTVNSFKKPVYLSTAGSDHVEIRNALLLLGDCPVTIMFCVGDYPARIVDFHHLEKLREHFGYGYQYGYSDHSTDVLNIPSLAVDHGASVIEKHVNFTNLRNTPDADHSITADEFALMVDSIEGSLDHDKTRHLTNKSMTTLWKRKYIATKDIAMGEKIRINVNVGIHRPMKKSDNAINTFRPWELPKVSSRAIPKGSIITYDMLDESI